MAHTQRRCPTCRKGVSTGKKCPSCGGTRFTYRVRYIDPSGKELSRSFKMKADADAFETEVAHTIRAGSYIDPAAGKITVKDYLEGWLAQQSHLRKSSRESYESMFRRRIYPHIGHLAISAVKPSTLRTWQANLARTYARSTIVPTRGVLSGALNDAALDRLIASNPFTGVKGPGKQERKKIVPRTVEQVMAAETAMNTDDLRRYKAIVPLVSGTGPRRGEAAGLTVDRVDFLRRELRIDRQLIGEKDGLPVFGPVKSDTSERVVPMPERVTSALAAHLAEFPTRPGAGFYLEDSGEYREITHGGLLFTTPDGRPLVRQRWNALTEPARRAMGLARGEGLHHLRHFYASLLIKAGRSPNEVKERLGHSSIKITFDVYGHLWPDSDEGTRAAVDAEFEAAEPSPDPKASADA